MIGKSAYSAVGSNQLNNASISEIVSREWGISLLEANTISRKRELVEFRYILMYAEKWFHPGKTLIEIARQFNKDHSTVIHGLKTIDDLVDINKYWFNRVFNLIKTIEKELRRTGSVYEIKTINQILDYIDVHYLARINDEIKILYTDLQDEKHMKGAKGGLSIPDNIEYIQDKLLSSRIRNRKEVELNKRKMSDC